MCAGIVCQDFLGVACICCIALCCSQTSGDEQSSYLASTVNFVNYDEHSKNFSEISVALFVALLITATDGNMLNKA